jgi:hypothetical protein
VFNFSGTAAGDDRDGNNLPDAVDRLYSKAAVGSGRGSIICQNLTGTGLFTPLTSCNASTS